MLEIKLHLLCEDDTGKVIEKKIWDCVKKKLRTVKLVDLLPPDLELILDSVERSTSSVTQFSGEYWNSLPEVLHITAKESKPLEYLPYKVGHTWQAVRDFEDGLELFFKNGSNSYVEVVSLQALVTNVSGLYYKGC